MFKEWKIQNFSKEVKPWFGQKLSSFPSFYLRQDRPEKCVSRYFRKEKRLLQTIKRRSLKSRKFVFFCEGKMSFYAIKRRKLKSRKMGVFPKGLVHGFGQKVAIFPFFLFQATLARKMCFTIFQNEKNIFLDHKNNNLKKLKN